MGVTLNEAKTSIKQAHRRASTFWVTRSGRIDTTTTADGIWGRPVEESGTNRFSIKAVLGVLQFSRVKVNSFVNQR